MRECGLKSSRLASSQTRVVLPMHGLVTSLRYNSSVSAGSDGFGCHDNRERGCQKRTGDIDSVTICSASSQLSGILIHRS